MTSHTKVLAIDCGTGTVTEAASVVAEMIEYGQRIIDIHADSGCDIYEQLDAHLESNYPDVSDVIRFYVIDVLTDEQPVSEGI